MYNILAEDDSWFNNENFNRLSKYKSTSIHKAETKKSNYTNILMK